MTITNRELNRRLMNLEACAEYAPERTYQGAKTAVECIGDLANMIRDRFREAGFNAGNDDRLRNVEVALYGYLLESNPQGTAYYSFACGEGFGESCSHDDARRNRAIAQAEKNRDTLGERFLP